MLDIENRESSIGKRGGNMCGRFTISTRKEKIEDAFDGAAVDEWRGPRYNVAPSQDVPVMLNDGSRRVVWARWGLVPHWAKDPAIGNKMINARAETLHEKPSFRKPFRSQRCLIIADGFYEWRTVPGQRVRTPLYIRLKSGDPFAFAGLWDRWKSPEGPDLLSCVIVTTTPNDLLSTIHDRMPVILGKETRNTWLRQDDVPLETLQACLAPYPAAEMTAHPVSTRVNSPRVDEPDLIIPNL
ncbi:MAG TPA: SOS response-associated peptidase [Kiritimatiellia bacterium]|jgi:putative SOS response-associated peptidase YedK